MDLAWMAWTGPTAVFFAAIALGLALMTLWHVLFPSVPRVGLLGLATTRGDRFFLTLLGSALIQLAWLAFGAGGVVWPAILCVAFALFAFRFL